MFYVAVARAKTRDAAGAQAAALEVKRLMPGAALGYHAAGFVAIELGHWADAEREYRSALRLAPTSADFLNNLGLAVLRQGRTHEATELFTQAGALEPTSERLRNNTRAAARAHTSILGAAQLRFNGAPRWVWLAGWFVLLQVVINLPDPWAAIGLAVIVGAPLIFAILRRRELPDAARHILRTDASRGWAPQRWSRRTWIIGALVVVSVVLSVVVLFATGAMTWS